MFLSVMGSLKPREERGLSQVIQPFGGSIQATSQDFSFRWKLSSAHWAALVCARGKWRSEGQQRGQTLQGRKLGLPDLALPLTSYETSGPNCALWP